MFKLKLVMLACAVFVAVQSRKLSDDEKEMMMMVTEECRKTHKATDEDIKNALEGKIPETESAKCTSTCIMKQFKIVKEDKLEVDVDTVVKLAQAQGADEEKIKTLREITEKCKAPTAANECDFSAAVATCAKKECESRGINMQSIQ